MKPQQQLKEKTQQRTSLKSKAMKQQQKADKDGHLSPKLSRPTTPLGVIKDRLRVLETERRARLRMTSVSMRSQEPEAIHRPRWDSSFLTAPSEKSETKASPWTETSSSMEFPLPKLVESVDDFTFPIYEMSRNISPDSTPRAFINSNVSKVKKKSIPVNSVRTGPSGGLISKSNSLKNAPRTTKAQSRVPSNEKSCVKSQQHRSGSNTKPLRKHNSSKATKRNSGGSNCVHTRNRDETGNVSKKARYKQSYKPPLPKAHVKQSHPFLKRSKQLGVQSFPHSDHISKLRRQNIQHKTKSTSLSLDKRKISLIDQILNPNSDRSSSTTDEPTQPNAARMKRPPMKKLPLSTALGRISPTSSTGYGIDTDRRSNSSKGSQYFNYYLEKFPSKCKMEVLTDTKRVALLKLLAQQLVNRIDAAQWNSSNMVDMSKVQAQAFSLRRSLAKVQKKLSSVEKALQGTSVTVPRKKVSGYIVLPSKLHLGVSGLLSKGSSNLDARETPAKSSLVDNGLEMQNNVSPGSSSSSLSRGYDGEISNRNDSTPTPRQELHGKQDSDLEPKPEVSQERKASIEELNSWDHRILLQELEKLDTEIRETKTRMANKLAHSSIADRDSTRSSMRSSMRSSLESNTLANPFTETTEIAQINQMSEAFRSSNGENLQQNLAGSGREAITSPTEDTSRSFNDGSSMDYLKTGLSTVDGYDSSVGISYLTERDTMSLCSSVFDEPKRANAAMMWKHRKSLGSMMDFLTDSLMQEALENCISDALSHKQGTRPENNYNNIDSLGTDIQAFTQELSSEDDSRQVVAIPDMSRQRHSECGVIESFKTLCKRWVGGYVDETLDTQGVFKSSRLLNLYISDDTSFTLPGVFMEDHQSAEHIYTKLLHDAICECINKQYTRFFLPSFFIYQEPCPEGPRLKRMVVTRVNEQADAACEGGFSLEHILEKSLDEEDWKHSYCNMLAIVNDVSDYLLEDIIDAFVLEGRNSCRNDATTNRLYSAQRNALCF